MSVAGFDECDDARSDRLRKALRTQPGSGSGQFDLLFPSSSLCCVQPSRVLCVGVGQTYHRACELRARVVFKLLSDQRVQLRALDTVHRNLTGHTRHLTRTASELDKQWTAHTQQQQLLSSGFERDLEALGRVELHRTLKVPPKRLTLLDCFEEKSIRKQYHQTAQWHGNERQNESIPLDRNSFFIDVCACDDVW